ncbi:hydroxyacid dehydrogenase [Candidatus Poribacteria bacterium]|nr:hydroxyacid dehydrogenase [Candidatus Poribacteria bacterium]MBT5534368.1 hydroxyacid dehydrogenase [Candidatus Poribacteria bacterium]MBT5709672.1 hydroxyacid dehydrogenase [Candidatus Poribacteria bacterium]MBT7098102.1 hydroxyacid dehydrogenase [Candidatus Poribacteria bacterium]MBT7805461.1 hydroxyacid dehydrogenase [Candidatus Poribacteria bacterium]
MSDILISERITGAAVDALSDDFTVATEPDLWRSPDDLRDRLAGFRALMVRNQTQVDARLIASAPSLEVIGRAGVGTDNIDLDAAKQHGVAVVYTPEQNAISVAELVMGSMLSLARHIPAASLNASEGGWDRHRFMGVELYGKTLGIVGLGRIGHRLGIRARAFGMDIVAHDPFVRADGVVASELRSPMLSLTELLARSDFVSCHMPLIPETKHLFNDAAFAAMRPTAYFVNAARGGVVDETALIRALRDGDIAGAALDVREVEPPVASPLNDMDNVILTPHIAALTDEAQERVVASLCGDVAAVLRGEMPAHIAR